MQAPYGDKMRRQSGVTNDCGAAGAGLVHGLSVPLHGCDAEIGVLSLARDTALPTGPARLHLFQRALWLTGAVQARMHALMADRTTRTTQNTTRQATSASLR